MLRKPVAIIKPRTILSPLGTSCAYDEKSNACVQVPFFNCETDHEATKKKKDDIVAITGRCFFTVAMPINGNKINGSNATTGIGMASGTHHVIISTATERTRFAWCETSMD
jgi:hypothetical protein